MTDLTPEPDQMPVLVEEVRDYRMAQIAAMLEVFNFFADTATLPSLEDSDAVPPEARSALHVIGFSANTIAAIVGAQVNVEMDALDQMFGRNAATKVTVADVIAQVICCAAIIAMRHDNQQLSRKLMEIVDSIASDPSLHVTHPMYHDGAGDMEKVVDHG